MTRIPPSTQRRVLRLIVSLLALLLLAPACAATPSITVTRAPTAEEIAAAEQAAKQFEATPAYLARVQQRTNQADSLRFEVYTTFNTSVFDIGSRTEPVMIGSQVDNRSRVSMDLGSLMGPLGAAGGFDPNAMTMTMVTDANLLYLNAPFLAEMTEARGLDSDADYAWVSELVNGWGRIDLAEIGGSDVLGEMGLSSGAGATEMLGLLQSAGVVLDGGRDEIRGVDVNLIFTEVSIVDIIEASGQDLNDMGISRSQLDVLDGVNANVAVATDDEGYVRRVEYTLDFSSLAELDPQMQGIEMTMWQRVDFFDFGEYVDVAVPVAAVDITNQFEDLLDEIN